MNNFIFQLDSTIATFKIQVPTYIYNVLINKEINTNIKQLKLIDEKLNQLLINLDASNLDKTIRKEKILEIQEIQTAIDKILLNYVSGHSTVQISIIELNNLNESIKVKNLEINKLQNEVTQLMSYFIQ